jgi:two-component system, OmpR family, phosphate regulon sensor histidine kinase PhoR
VNRTKIFPTGGLFGVLLGAVVIPAGLSLTIGILAIVLWDEAFDIVLGILILTFAVSSMAGGILALAFLKRSARLAEMQADFVANVTHELRTPLAGIRLLVETLEKGRAKTPEQLAVVVTRLGVEEQRLEDLIDRILHWRKLQLGAPGPRSWLDTSAVVREAVELASAGKTGVIANIDDDLPTLYGDHEGLIGAIRNLVDNAIKFGGNDGPVEVRAWSEDEHAVFEVRDQGPGIPQRERKHIFEPFYRIPAYRHLRGTGLGLAIVRRVVLRHEAELEIDDHEGKGTIVRLKFPVSIPGESSASGKIPILGGDRDGD